MSAVNSPSCCELSELNLHTPSHLLLHTLAAPSAVSLTPHHLKRVRTVNAASVSCFTLISSVTSTNKTTQTQNTPELLKVHLHLCVCVCLGFYFKSTVICLNLSALCGINCRLSRLFAICCQSSRRRRRKWYLKNLVSAKWQCTIWNNRTPVEMHWTGEQCHGRLAAIWF